MKLRVSCAVEFEPSRVRGGIVSESWIVSAFQDAFKEFFESTHSELNEVMEEHGLIEVYCKDAAVHHIIERPQETVPEGWTAERIRRIQLVRCTLCNAGRGERCRNKNSDGISQAMSVPHAARYDRALAQGTVGPMETRSETTH